ncbi:MAG: ATP-binding cassette domain-containing protein, partial [Planctomycetota bacterium]
MTPDPAPSPRRTPSAPPADPAGGAPAPVLVARGVRKVFAGGIEAVRGVDLTVREGETAVVIGPSGAGKSTFLRCLNGLETMDAGEVTVAGVHLVPKRRVLRRIRGMV